MLTPEELAAIRENAAAMIALVETGGVAFTGPYGILQALTKHVPELLEHIEELEHEEAMWRDCASDIGGA